MHLFEAEYNLFLKLIWGSRLVWQAEAHGILADDMQGYRKLRSTMDLQTKKIFSYNIARQSRRSNMAIFDNNAASCCDRILVNFGMVLCARMVGMPVSAVMPCLRCNASLRNLTSDEIYHQNSMECQRTTSAGLTPNP